jgi:1,4-dihydroxy-2-naphthoate polyprenyltransferase
MQQQIQNSPHLPLPKHGTTWKVWWRLLRPHTLTAAFVPVFIGTVLAMEMTNIDYLLFFAMLMACLLIQAATNMVNEYYDYVRGLDNEQSVGIGGAIVRDGIRPKTVLNLAFIFFGISVLLGVYICLESNWWIAVIGTICMIAGYLYTGGPRPIAYTPFGELVAGLFMGLIIIVLSFYIQTDMITAKSILISIPISVLVGAILLANNIRDLDGDKENGRRTIAILIGRKNAITLLGLMLLSAFVWISAMVVFGSLSLFTFLIFLSIPKALAAYNGFKGKTKPIEMMPAMKATAQTNTIFGFLLGIGLLIGVIL